MDELVRWFRAQLAEDQRVAHQISDQAALTQARAKLWLLELIDFAARIPGEAARADCQELIKVLASQYDWHPDYRAEWRPGVVHA